MKRLMVPPRKPKAPKPQNHSEELIRLSDFSSMHIEVQLQNNTTHMPIRSEPPVVLLELQERGMVLEIPSKSCSQGHNLMVEMRATTPDRAVYTFTSTARVNELENYPDGTDRVTLALLQFDEDVWESFCKSFSSRQDEIEQFFRAAKGY